MIITEKNPHTTAVKRDLSPPLPPSPNTQRNVNMPHRRGSLVTRPAHRSKELSVLRSARELLHGFE